MNRRQFLSLSALTCFGATPNAPAAGESDAKHISDFDIAFIAAGITWPDGTVVEESTNFTLAT